MISHRMEWHFGAGQWLKMHPRVRINIMIDPVLIAKLLESAPMPEVQIGFPVAAFRAGNGPDPKLDHVLKPFHRPAWPFHNRGYDVLSKHFRVRHST